MCIQAGIYLFQINYIAAKSFEILTIGVNPRHWNQSALELQ